MAGGVIAYVAPDSPADDVGFVPGCIITSVDGHALRDVLDWRWYADGDTVSVAYRDTDGDCGTVALERHPGQAWGIEFETAVFDGIRRCCNACTFCFMRQLPDGMRPSLALRDDDYRLSFLQGTFVTFTNLGEADKRRIVDQAIFPLRWSLHAVDGDVRKHLIGQRAQEGFRSAEELLQAGVLMYAQIVLVPGVNDGAVLERTLTWAYEHPGICQVGIVPLGFTRYQDDFHTGFTQPASAGEVLRCVEPFRSRALRERGYAWVHCADEFYCNAYGNRVVERIPEAAEYGSFEMFEDGVGMVRSFVDDWNGCAKAIDEAANELRSSGTTAVFVCGRAQQPFFGRLLEESALAGLLEPLYVDNRYFGGNVTVTGLLCGVDIIECLRGVLRKGFTGVIAVPRVIFNDDGLTLDDMSAEDIASAVGRDIHVVSCNPSGFIPQITGIAREEKDTQ